MIQAHDDSSASLIASGMPDDEEMPFAAREGGASRRADAMAEVAISRLDTLDASCPPVAAPADGSLLIESLDQDGRGVGRRNGKVIFVEGALAGERVSIDVFRSKSSYEVATVSQIHRSSPLRVEPRCPHFKVCGGCAMQHVDAGAQVAIKQRVLEDTFWHLSKLRPEYMLPPIHGPYWGYRHRARLSVRALPKPRGVYVGFREKKSSHVADVRECHILPPHVNDLLMPLRTLIGAMSKPDRLPQIEVAVGDDVTVLVLRHLVPLVKRDLILLADFAEAHKIQWWLQPDGPETLHPLLRADREGLSYTLPEFGLRMPYRPSDFTQVNPGINRVLVSRALQLLEAQPTDRIADMFCGLGNFTLPLATQCREVVGVEGLEKLTQRAEEAARRHGLDVHSSFSTLNLFEVDARWLRSLGHFDRMLIDPPREGALALAQALADIGSDGPQRIVYVSCNPSTLSRDAAILVHQGGYVLRSAGVVNMFPHTGHVESIAVFEPGPRLVEAAAAKARDKDKVNTKTKA